MLERKAYLDLLHWKQSHAKSCLMVNGARQVGKTYIIRNTLEQENCEYIEFNLIKTPEIIELLSKSENIDDMIEAVKWALDCNEKVTKIETMMGEAQYADEVSQENLKVLLDAAKKEQTYSRDNLKKLYESEITRTDNYLRDVNLAITEVGNKGEALELTRTRVSSQMETIEELKSNNENEDLSSIMLNYSAAYVAYQAALTAASKIGEQSLLNYI